MTKKDSVISEQEDIELSLEDSRGTHELSFLQNKRLSKKRNLLRELQSVELPESILSGHEDEVYSQLLHYAYYRIQRLLEKEGATTALFTILTGDTCYDPYSAVPFQRFLIESGKATEVQVDEDVDRSVYDISFSIMIDTEMLEYYESFETSPKCGCGKVFRITRTDLPGSEGQLLPEKGKLIWCSSPTAL